MTGAERQARYRAQHVAGTPKLRYRTPLDRRSRPTRWADAVAELVRLQSDYQDWLDQMPEPLRDSATAQALEAVCELDLTVLEIDLPRGFGRD